MPSVRQTINRPLGGFDRSRQSHASRPGVVYDLLNMRPVRGELQQTNLIGNFVDEFNDAILIVYEIFSGWVTFQTPSRTATLAEDFTLWTTFNEPTYSDLYTENFANWTLFP